MPKLTQSSLWASHVIKLIFTFISFYNFDIILQPITLGANRVLSQEKSKWEAKMSSSICSN